MAKITADINKQKQYSEVESPQKNNVKKRYEVLDEFNYPPESNITRENYVQNRILKQLKWYDTKSVKYRNHYYRYLCVTIILNGLVPLITFLTGIENPYTFWVKLLIIACGTSAGIITAIMAVYKYGDIWCKYRINCEMLKSVLHSYKTRTGEFNTSNERQRFNMLVEKSENYLVEEYKKEAQLFTPSSPIKNSSDDNEDDNEKNGVAVLSE